MPRVPIRKLIRASDDVILVDGGTGSSMEDRGVDVRTDLWSSFALLTPEGREATRALHADFLAAGADVVIANTHNVNPNTCRAFLDGHDLSDFDVPANVDRDAFLEWIERTGVDVANGTVPPGRDVVVAAGIGSEEPWARRTSRTRAEIEEALEPCARALGTSNETLVLFESLSTPPELAAVAELARRGAARDFGVGLTCSPDGTTWGGIPMHEAVRQLAGTSVAAFFVQCTRYDVAATALGHLVDALVNTDDMDAAPGVYANDGRIWKNRRWHGERISPGAYADAAEEWRALGARLIGGCCGTTPEHVAELRRRL